MTWVLASIAIFSFTCRRDLAAAAAADVLHAVPTTPTIAAAAANSTNVLKTDNSTTEPETEVPTTPTIAAAAANSTNVLKTDNSTTEPETEVPTTPTIAAAAANSTNVLKTDNSTTEPETEVSTTGATMSAAAKSTQIQSTSNSTTESVSRMEPIRATDGRPICGREAVIPVQGHVHPVTVHGKTGWDFRTVQGCSYALREDKHIAHCLADSWVVVSGSSEANLMMSNLVNTLVPGGLVAGFGRGHDGFNSEGIFSTLVDVIVANSTVTYKKVYRARGRLYGSHSPWKDKQVEKKAWGLLWSAPPPKAGDVRITFMLAQYWDEVTHAVQTLNHAKQWAGAKVFFVANIGQWYDDSMFCQAPWCATRPALMGTGIPNVLHNYAVGLEATLKELKPFCSEGGLAGEHGCTLMGMATCGATAQSSKAAIDRTFKKIFRPHTTQTLRLLDLWTLSQHIPEQHCLRGHSTPVMASFFWQVLLSSVCKAQDAAEGTLAFWHGPTCRFWQIHQQCPSVESVLSCNGFPFSWDFALRSPCKLIPLVAPEKMHISKTHLFLRENSIHQPVLNDLPMQLQAGMGSSRIIFFFSCLACLACLAIPLALFIRWRGGLVQQLEDAGSDQLLHQALQPGAE
eukprot:TRINITY_DN964_c0_g1_i1.p1 TRINITY_DN964_c0_g1~~TRINITY_DN964_c0_g1_i1.p1  ORF type:complete len:627 (-),score=107.87 TRINITY_DN964_c0_g1_i1:22-1902(-)